MISSSIGPCDQLLDLLSYPNLWLSMGYHQIKSEPTIFVMLSTLGWLLEHTPLHLLVWPILSPCSHDGGSPVIWKFRWVVVEPISSILSPPWFMLNINLVLETFIGIFFMPRSWSICWMKEVTSFDSRAFDVSCRREFEEVCFYLLWNHPKSGMHVRRILWSVRLIIFIPYVSLAHQATDSFVQEEVVPS